MTDTAADLSEGDRFDRDDMERLTSGDDAALNSLMDRHGAPLFHYLIRCLANDDDAADLSQEAFVRVYQNRLRFNPHQKFSTWLYSIATNLVKDRYRWRSRHPTVSLDGQSSDEQSLQQTLADEKASPREKLVQSERAESVRRAVSDLPEELRLPLILFEYEDRSQAEIAVILNCSAKAVETRIYRARNQLRKSLKELANIS